MALVDPKALVNNLINFYDFRDKTVLAVGAGGGQITDYAEVAKKVIAIDINPKAMESLKNVLEQKQLMHKFEMIISDFMALNIQADVVYFEFSLHEMPDPLAALQHASRLAPEILIFDHLPESKWIYCAVEEDHVANAWKAVEKQSPTKRARFEGLQFFNNYSEIVTKLQNIDEPCASRIAEFKFQTNFTIPMPYGIAVIS